MRFSALALFAALACAPAASLHAHEQPQAAAPRLVALQQRDATLFATGWRLATGNAAYCDGASPAPGILVHDANAYGDREAVRAQLGLSGDIGVQAVAPGSPAAHAGVTANMTLVSLDGVALDAAFPRAEPRWQRLVDLHAAMAKAFENGSATLGFAGTPQSTGPSPVVEVTLEGQRACPSRFEVLDEGKKAVADGARVILGRDFPGFDFPPDQFAAAVAHELAHNLLRHRVLLDREGRSRKLRRLTERDADRLMPWLLYNAGFDPHAAARFMENWGRNHGRSVFTRALYNEGWDERLEHIEAEITHLETVLAQTGEADWSRHFRREAEGEVRPLPAGER